MLTTWHTMFASQAEAFAEFDHVHKGTWLMVSEAFSARDLFRIGWLLCTIGTDQSRMMYDWVSQKRNQLMSEVQS